MQHEHTLRQDLQRNDDRLYHNNGPLTAAGNVLLAEPSIIFISHLRTDVTHDFQEGHLYWPLLSSGKSLSSLCRVRLSVISTTNKKSTK